MEQLKTGFGRVIINPPMGIEIAGYFITRRVEGILDDLEANAVALSLGDKKVLLITVDHCGLWQPLVEDYKNAITEKTGVPKDAIFIHSTHTHTAPMLMEEDKDELMKEYRLALREKLVEVSVMALADLKDSKMGYAVGQAPNIAFIRRYRMKDGSTRTNPGVNNPDIVAPIGEVDERVNVVRFDRENGETIVLANFGDHPDTVGGNLISGDWPSFTRKFVEKAIDNTKCIFFNGAQGDVNHVNVHPKAGDFNDMFNDFDGCSRGYGHARHMGRVVAGGVMQVYDKVNYVDVDRLEYLQRTIDIPSNMPTEKDDMELAHKYNDLHLAGRDDEIPFKAMMLTTVVAEAGRLVKLEHGPEFFPAILSGVKIGPIAIMGLPCEPFTGIGLAIKETEGYDLILPCCNTNAKVGYFPMMDAYLEGGYEAKGSAFKAGSAEILIEESKKVLNDMNK